MNTFVLKLIACVTMFIDHYTALFVSQQMRTVHIFGLHSQFPVSYLTGRIIGRIAFPIYCFLLVEGFFRTRDRRKYMVRLAVFALLSELPFDLAFQGKGKPLEAGKMLEHQNVMFTLLLGFLLMYVYEWIKMKYFTQPYVFNTLGVIAIVGIGGAAAFLKTDYGMGGVLLIMVFYFFRGRKCLLFFGTAVVMFFFLGRLELFGLVAFLPIFLYNGTCGPRLKYAFYAFYPLHLLGLWAAAYVF